jgi:hypothetical protein
MAAPMIRALVLSGEERAPNQANNGVASASTTRIGPREFRQLCSRTTCRTGASRYAAAKSSGVRS